MAAADWVALVRDIVIIVWGVLGIIAFAVVILVFLGIYRGLKPVLRSLRATTGNIQVTTTMVTDALVRPLIPVISFYSGIRQGSRTIRRFLRWRS